jgi:hypothetical protein
MPRNSENGPSVATLAMLMRQSNVPSEAPGGSMAISVVEPPLSFHGVARRLTGAHDFQRPAQRRLGKSRLFSRAQSIARS